LPRVLFFCKQHMHEYLNHPIKLLTHIFLIVLFIFLCWLLKVSLLLLNIFSDWRDVYLK
jgi:hypothetical protein